MREKVITGEWNGEPIWRWETPEEMFTRLTGEDSKIARLFIGLNER